MGTKFIRSTNDDICLNIVHSVYKKKTVYTNIGGGDSFAEKKEVLVKQIIVKKWFKKEAITSVEEYVTSKNKVAKSRSIIFDKYSSRFYATFHNVDEIMNNINNRTYKNQIGFKHDTDIHPIQPQVFKHR